MKIIAFNIKKGIYHFELNDLKAEFHAHPAVEVINAVNGKFSVKTSDAIAADITFAIIDSNVKHQVISDNSCVQLLMIESHNPLLYNFMNQFGVDFKGGIFTERAHDKKSKLFKGILAFCADNPLKKVNDERVERCLRHFETESPGYHQMVHALKSEVHLSESRLAHIFKDKIGVSLKKYLVWSKLKKAIYLILNEDLNLLEASFQSGFYDQAHLSNAFKKVLGISPSKVYNSRTIQL